MATVRILLGIVYLTFVGSSLGAVGGIVNERGGTYDENTRKLLAIAQKEIGVQESAENYGKAVNAYNAYVGFKRAPWCASFVSWCFGKIGYPQPRTAWSPGLFPTERLAKDPVAGMVMGIYFADLKRVGHCGIVEQVKGDLVVTIEGNTNLNGSRNGDGVYRRLRHARTIRCYADWLRKGNAR